MSGITPSLRHFFPPALFKKVSNAHHRVQKLPLVYQKFHDEWKDEASSTPVHWIPTKDKWTVTAAGEVKQVQNCPIPVKYPHQMNYGIWGGEGVVQGLIRKKGKYTSPISRFWVPTFQETVVYSEILDKYLSVMVTERALRLIDHHCGLDNYLLQSPANDLKGLLPLKLKRHLYLALLDKDFARDDPQKQDEIYNKYKKYMIPREEAEWYGLSLEEAEAKWAMIKKSETISKIVPLKLQYRVEFLQQLKEETTKPPDPQIEESWATKLNPFTKPKGVPPPKKPNIYE